MQVNKVLYEDYTCQICWRKDKRLQRNKTYSSDDFFEWKPVAAAPNFCIMLDELFLGNYNPFYRSYFCHFGLRLKIGCYLVYEKLLTQHISGLVTKYKLLFQQPG